jgi:hypothetical protein
MKKIVLFATLLFIGLTGFSQATTAKEATVKKTKCCAKNNIKYKGNGTLVWQTETGKYLDKNTPKKNRIANPFEKEIMSDKPLEVKIINMSGNPIVWGVQTFNYQKNPNINLDLSSLIAGRYKIEFMLDGTKSEKYFDYKLENKLLGGESSSYLDSNFVKKPKKMKKMKN